MRAVNPLLVALILGAAWARTATPATPAMRAPEGLDVRFEPGAAHIRWHAPAIELRPDLKTSYRGPGLPVSLEAAGLRPMVDPGKPALAARVLLVALPPGAAPRIELLGSRAHEESEIWIDAAATSPVEDSEEDGRAGGYRSVPDPELYSTDAFWPAAPATILSRGVARDTDFALVQVVPFQWNPVRRVLRVLDELDLRVRFDVRLDEPAQQEALPEPASSERGGPGAGARERHREVGTESGAGNVSGEAPILAAGGVPASWRVRRASPELARIANNLNPAAAGPAWKLEVVQDGLYRVTQAELAAAGFPVSTDIAKLKLELRGQPVPIRVRDPNRNGLFDAGDEILFYGLANPEHYSGSHVYWLTASGGGRFMSEEPAMPPAALGYGAIPSYVARTRVEKNQFYLKSVYLDPAAGDPWMFPLSEAIKLNGPLCSGVCSTTCPWSESLTIPEPAAPESGRTYALRGRFVARNMNGSCASGAQAVEVSLNGKPVGTVRWAIASDTTGLETIWSIPIDPAILVPPPGTNTLGLAHDPASTEAHYTYVDYLELESPARFKAASDVLEARGDWTTGVVYAAGFGSPDLEIVDVRSDGSVGHLTGYKILSQGPSMPLTAAFAVGPTPGVTHRIAAYARAKLLPVKSLVKDQPSTLADLANAAQHLSIAYKDFLPAAQALSDWRTTHGIAARSVDVQDVYDEFSWGNVDPQAIHDFVAYAFSKWSVAPIYVLLVGDSSYDFRNYMNLSAAGYPPASTIPYKELVMGRVIPGSAGDTPGGIGQIEGSDFFFQELTGDDFPDVLLGRLAVRTPAEADNYVQKVKTYEAQSGGSAWNGRYLFVTDDNIEGLPVTGCPAADGEIELFMRGLISTYLSKPNVSPIDVEVKDYTRTDAVSKKIRDERNTGVATMFYFGHGSIFSYGTRECPPVPATPADRVFLWQDSDVNSLTNSTALPFSTSVACDVGAFHFASPGPPPITRCYGEAFTVETKQGDLGYVGGTIEISPAEGKGQLLGMVDGMFQPGSSFLPAFPADASRRAGAIHYAAQMGFLTNPAISGFLRWRDERTTVLFGDPAAKLLLTQPQ